MKKIKLSIIALLSFTIILISCEISSKSNVDEMNTTIKTDKEKTNKTNVDSSAISDTIIATQKQVDSKAQRFMHHLKTGAKLNSFF